MDEFIDIIKAAVATGIGLALAVVFFMGIVFGAISFVEWLGWIS